MRTFNTTGPCDPEFHYLLPPLERAPAAMGLVRGRSYLGVSGPRQCGKTSLLRALVDAINADGWARALILSSEAADRASGVEAVDEAEQLLVGHWLTSMAFQWPDMPAEVREKTALASAGGRLFAVLSAAAIASEKPLVVVIDEVDSLARKPFISALRQIRDGFQHRSRAFPHSIVLAGMRNLRDHDIAMGGAGSGSPFNIVEFVTVGNFSRDEVVRLYAQHTAETGQRFTEDAIELVWNQTRGQPWLVNAIARTCVMDLVPDTLQAIEPKHIEEAIRRIETGNSTHLTSLTHRLAEDRVMNVVAPIVVGDAPDVSPDDLRYAVELGIVEPIDGDRLRAANPIYARTLLRAVTSQARTRIATWSPTWLVDGRIDLDRLRENFLSFWALNRNMMKDRITYPEAVAHFGLMTYLDRVANGGGRVDREYAVGLGRLDLLLIHGDLKLPIEVKVHRDLGGDPVPQGLEQLDRYCEGLRVHNAWLIVFDQRSTATGTRLESEEVVTTGGRKGLVVRA